jgi:predicted transcriptional regulator of viral defense system
VGLRHHDDGAGSEVDKLRSIRTESEHFQAIGRALIAFSNGNIGLADSGDLIRINELLQCAIQIIGKILDIRKVLYHISSMEQGLARQEDRAISLLQKRRMMRVSEFIEEGITSATISRMEQRGLLNQLARGLYQLPDASLDTHHSLAVAAKLVPNGVICYDSALSFHELTDRIPSYVWVAIGPRDWRPKIERPRLQIARFSPKDFEKGIEQHTIEGVSVSIYSAAKTIVDLFKSGRRQNAFYKSTTGLAHATQAMKEALRLRKTTPAEIAKFAIEAGVWEKIAQPRLEALTVDA